MFFSLSVIYVFMYLFTVIYVFSASNNRTKSNLAIHLEGPSGLVREIMKLELWKCDFLGFGHQILVTVLVTLQDLVTLSSRNAVRNCICGRDMPPPPAPRSGMDI